jgi:hypothetical protein
MSAPPLVNTFAGGTDTVDISPANSGGTSGDALDTVTVGTGVTIKYSATQKRPNSGFSANVIQPATGVTSYMLYSGFASLTTSVYFRMYIYQSLNNVSTAYWGIRNNLDAACAFVYMNSSGRITFQNAAGGAIATASNVSLPTNQWFRLELRVLPSTTVGEIEYRVFLGSNIEGSVPDDSTVNTGQILAANIGGVRQGIGITSGLAGSGQNAYVANLGVSAVDWVGAYNPDLHDQRTSLVGFPKYPLARMN